MFSSFASKVRYYGSKVSGATTRRFSSSTEPSTYSTGVQLMHWLSGGSMAACVGLVLQSQSLPKEKNKEKMEIMHYHKSFGTLALLLLVPRLLLRVTSKTPGPLPGSHTLEHLAGKLSHYAMYGFVIFMPVSGAGMALLGPKGLPFFSMTIPPADAAMRKSYGFIAKYSYEYHKVAGVALEYFIPLHVGAAFFHSIRGQAIFSRIVPGLASKAGK